jgi:glycosyltransferase involved in cell wall biosynthesis
MKIAVIHDWLVTCAGAERVLEQILSLYPAADLFTLVDYLPRDDRTFLHDRSVHTSFLQYLPFAKRKYRSFLPLMPRAIERLDIRGYDLVISSSHAVAKNVRTSGDQLHICYCHTPMRYAWDLRDQYLRESRLDRGVKGLLARRLLDRIRRWDAASSARVNHFVANSRYIADRIKRCYGRDSTVIYPPVDLDGFSLREQKEDFYVAASRMVPYKRMDMIVEAFSSMPDQKLIVIGDGPDLEKVRSKAAGNIELVGRQPPMALRDYLQRAQAFVFAANEDFGIIPVEAQACGTPVIAFGRGGVKETIVPLQEQGTPDGTEERKPTGVFFSEQTPSSLAEAVKRFERNRDAFDPREIRKNVERFSRDRFRTEFKDFVDTAVKTWRP